MRWGSDRVVESGLEPAASSSRVSATRIGPRRFTSTAPSNGTSKVTASHHWTTVSQDEDPSASDVVEQETVASDVAGDRVESPSDNGIEVIAELSSETIEAVIAEDIATSPLCRGLALAGAHEHHYFAFGHASEQALDERHAEEAGRPVTAIRRPASSSGITDLFLASGHQSTGDTDKNCHDE